MMAFSGGSNINTPILKSFRTPKHIWNISEGDVIVGKSSEKCKVVGCKDGESEPQANERGQPSATREGKKISFLLESLEKNTVLLTP